MKLICKIATEFPEKGNDILIYTLLPYSEITVLINKHKEPWTDRICVWNNGENNHRIILIPENVPAIMGKIVTDLAMKEAELKLNVL